MATTTMGDLVSNLFDKYEQEFHDETLAAIATHAAIVDMLRDSRRGRFVRLPARHAKPRSGAR